MISIIEDNAFFLVLYKPEGVSTHNEQPSLSDWLLANKHPQNFVNRLDSQTSGLVVVAKRSELHAPLHQALHNGKKIYRALLRGHWVNKPNNLIWNLPLTDKAEGRKNPQGKSSERKNCITHVNVLRTNKYFTEVLCEIKTGRQHQIRKHACLARHPIVGDSRYNDDSYNQKIAALYKTSRMLLNAEELSFSFSNINYHFIAPKMNCDAFFS